ncbi:MAG: cysteine desulfurase family protein [bacterium]
MMVYLDNIATTPIDPRVFDEMLPYFKEEFGNPSSIYTIGQGAKNAIICARERIASLISSKPDEIIFTSSATEANNLAIKGIANALSKNGKHIISSSIEHISILHPLRTLEKEGFEVTFVGVDKEARVNPNDIKKALRDNTILVSIQLANPETGTIQPIKEIAKVIKGRSIIFHTDAVAACGRIPINVNELCVDTLTISGHQFYGPKGVGCLYVRKGTRLYPEIEGGIQEKGRRGGTENVASIVGMGKAANLVMSEMEEWDRHILKLQNMLIDGIFKNCDGVYLNSPKEALPGIINLSFDFVEGESLLISLDLEGICVASGSPCVSTSLKASHVLSAMGISPVLAHSSLLFSLGKENKESDIGHLLNVFPSILKRLRLMSPLAKR